MKINIPTLEVNEDIPQLDNIFISPSIVCRVISELKSEKSTGPNGWPTQEISLPLWHCLSYLINP